ncbi:MAG: bifunctional UDP-N-acetylglucosamine diphosphorylase/glucosamine-1-phosphate N-acetyltransferase GlmU [Legionellales bacterium]|nr:bifunctional UDP-N-acetylglucosamine diphosphorylase/glucosamine-1-phosphate N-acetyltransferase GlmU [Legionellales bacterium]
MALHVIILAAGLGQRMHSAVPKVLHTIAGRSMLEHVIATAQALQPENIHVVIGHAADTIQAACQHVSVNWITQTKQLGTGHAVLQALPHIPNNAHILVLYGDVPLLRAETLQNLISVSQAHAQSLSLLLAKVPKPYGLGRIIRDPQNQITAIIEEKDTNEQQRAITEIYSGICCVSAGHLNRWLPKITPQNAQAEYYFTDIVALAKAEQQTIASFQVSDYQDILGVNDRFQLQQAERIWQQRTAQQLLLSGVGIADAQRIDIRGTLHCEKDVFIDVNNVFIGQVQIGTQSVIEPNCVLTDVTIGARCRIASNCVLEDCHIGDDCQIGPFARIRPGTQLAAHCKIGNFVEAKKAIFGEHSKASHLSYLGDVTIGKDVNIGAGTITCNYDGANKYQTIIEDGVHIGSDTQLIAPVTIGKNATIGAGSTIRSNVPSDELTLTISQQKTIRGWKRKKKLDKE